MGPHSTSCQGYSTSEAERDLHNTSTCSYSSLIQCLGDSIAISHSESQQPNLFQYIFLHAEWQQVWVLTKHRNLPFVKQQTGCFPQLALLEKTPDKKFQHLSSSPGSPNGPTLNSRGGWFQVVIFGVSELYSFSGVASFFCVTGFVVLSVVHGVPSETAFSVCSRVVPLRLDDYSENNRWVQNFQIIEYIQTEKRMKDSCFVFIAIQI